MSTTNEEMYVFKTFEPRKIKARTSIPYRPDTKRGYKNAAFADSKNVYILGYFWICEQNNKKVVSVFHNVIRRSKQLWKFNFATTEWTKCNLPRRLQLIRSVFIHKNVLMILDKSYSLYTMRLGDEHEFNVVQTTGTVPTFRPFSHSRVLHGDYLYQVGFEFVHDEVHRLNLRTFVWETLYKNEDGGGANELVNRGECNVACDGENIFLLAGYVGGQKIHLCDIPVFNLECRQWTQKSTIGDEKVSYNNGFPPLDEGFIFSVSFQLQPESAIYLTLVAANEEKKQKEVSLWKLDTLTLCWSFIHNYSSPFEVIATTFLEDGKHYVVTTSEDYKNNDVFVTSFSACVPKLIDLSWEAVVHYTKGVNKEKLISLGLPMFFNRVE